MIYATFLNHHTLPVAFIARFIAQVLSIGCSVWQTVAQVTAFFCVCVSGGMCVCMLVREFLMGRDGRLCISVNVSLLQSITHILYGQLDIHLHAYTPRNQYIISWLYVSISMFEYLCLCLFRLLFMSISISISIFICRVKMYVYLLW